MSNSAGYGQRRKNDFGGFRSVIARAQGRRIIGRRRLKLAVARALHQVRLLFPAFRLYQRWLAFRSAGDLTPLAEPVAGAELPFPPPRLRVLVCAGASLDEFLLSGAQTADEIRELVNGTFEHVSPVLDFGCGCGRVLRHFAGAQGVFFGSDYNAEAIGWCRENLGFASFLVNGPEPPLALDDEAFGLLYAISVFTHLPEAAQRAWLREFARVLRPAGLLIFTTHGSAVLDHMTARERRAFERGEFVVRFEDAVGTNLCNAYHPPAFTARLLQNHFKLLDHREGCHGSQDFYLAKRLS
jgi:SAM-dependent methyltransferase